MRPVLDDELGPAFDNIFGCNVDASSTMTWQAQRDDVVYRVDRAMDATGLPDHANI